jgi:hypothetical protein
MPCGRVTPALIASHQYLEVGVEGSAAIEQELPELFAIIESKITDGTNSSEVVPEWLANTLLRPPNHPAAKTKRGVRHLVESAPVGRTTKRSA